MKFATKTKAARRAALQRRGHGRSRGGNATWPDLQSTLGNRAIQRLLEASRAAKNETPLPVAPIVQRAIEARQGHGQPLDAGLKARMERTLAADLEGISIHVGPEADLLTKGLGAKAFTQGRDIFLGAGHEPSSAEATQTLAHELTHASDGKAASGTVQRQELDEDQLKVMGGNILGALGNAAKTAGGALAGTGVLAGPGALLEAGGEKAAEVGGELTASGGMAGMMKGIAEALGQASPPNPAMQAMWDAAVTDNLNGAVESLTADKPNVRRADSQMETAMHTMKSLADTYRKQGNEPLADKIAVQINRLVAGRVALQPYMGASETPQEVAGFFITAGMDKLTEIREQLR